MYSMSTFPKTRLSRLRQSMNMRSLVQETRLNIEQLILPLFIKHGCDLKHPIASMPGHFQWSVDRIHEIIEEIWSLGIRRVILFGVPEVKDPLGSDSYADDGIIQLAIARIKDLVPDMLVISDVCLCEYTDHGHCGAINDVSTVREVILDNQHTLELLAAQVVSHARAGVDVVAPSGNIDGMVGAIRKALDAAGYEHLPILSYAVKYASSFYGPFRQAAEGAPRFGDRRTYQMDYANAREALHECALDVSEGADFLMVKPAHTYLDIIYRVKEAFPYMPLGAYHPSGEYAMLKAAAEKGWVNEQQAVMEVLTGILRAGADFIITYYAQDVVKWLRS